jgi:hypothetical protein
VEIAGFVTEMLCFIGLNPAAPAIPPWTGTVVGATAGVDIRRVLVSGHLPAHQWLGAWESSPRDRTGVSDGQPHRRRY